MPSSYCLSLPSLVTTFAPNTVEQYHLLIQWALFLLVATWRPIPSRLVSTGVAYGALAALSLLPFVIIMITSFVKISVVLSM